MFRRRAKELQNQGLPAGELNPRFNAIVKIYIHACLGLISYKNQNGEVLTSVEFSDRNVEALNGSFKKGFKQIGEFDRQQVNTVKNKNTSIDRASFRLAEVN